MLNLGNGVGSIDLLSYGVSVLIGSIIYFAVGWIIGTSMFNLIVYIYDTLKFKLYHKKDIVIIDIVIIKPISHTKKHVDEQ